jgi:multidrug efflux pump subunit AcrA (membrane-fusion protein)
VVAPTPPPIATPTPTTPTPTPTTPPTEPPTPPTTEPTPPPAEPTTPPPTEPTPTTPPPEPAPTEPTEPETPPEPAEPKKPPKKRPTSTTTTTPTEAAPTEAAPSTSEAQLYPAVVDGGKSESVKTRTGGRVKSVDVKDGDTVAKGQVLVTFDSGADPAEIATLEDRIASLENADDEEAKRELKAAKQKLAALEGGAKAQPIVAGMDGKLSGFGVSVGTVLRAGETVGKIGDGDVPARVWITVPRGKVSKGQTVQLVLKGGGAAEGTVLSVSGKTVVVDTGAEPGDAVDAVKF